MLLLCCACMHAVVLCKQKDVKHAPLCDPRRAGGRVLQRGGGGEGAKISYYSLAMSFHQVGQLAVAFSSQGSPQGSPV